MYPEDSTCIENDHFQIIQQGVCDLPDNVDHFLIGDFNSRTRYILDYVIGNIHGSDGDLSNIIDDNPYNQTSVYSYLSKINKLQRKTLDNKPRNKYAICLADLCITSNMFILNGRFGNDDLGYHTRIETNGCSLVDYVLATPNSHTLIKKFYVDSKLPESDHLPLQLVLKTGTVLNIMQENQTVWTPLYKYTWKRENLSKLQSTINDTKSLNYKKIFRNSILELNDVSHVTSNFLEYVTQACDRTFSRRKVKTNLSNKPD